MNSKSYNVLYL